MTQQVTSHPATSDDPVAEPVSRERLVVVTGVLLIAVQLGFRGWASFHGWFYADDFEFLDEATGRHLSLSYLLTPHDSQLMPGGVLAAWVVAHAGVFAWPVAAAMLVGLQALASAACLRMLVVLFGRRWLVRAPLALYLFSSLTLTAFMWWSAAINQLPLHAVLFAAVTAYVSFERHRRRRDLLLVLLLLAAGLCFYVKTILVVGVLAALALCYFTDWTGGLWRGLRSAIRARWALWGGMAVLAVTYVAYYTVHVPSPVEASVSIPFGDVADAMFRRTLAPGLVGGPWRWNDVNPPLGQSAAPEAAVAASLVVLTAVLVLALRRRGSWRALVVLLPYLTVTYLLTAFGRGGALGGYVGLEPRYLADSMPVICLCAALLWMPVRPSERSPHRSSLTAARTRVVVVAAVALGTGAAWSNVAYARLWTAPYPAKAYVQSAVEESAVAPLRLMDEPVPELVQSVTSYPSNLPSHLLAPLGDRVDASDSGTDLEILGSSGRPYPPVIADGASSAAGPDGDCGYAVSTAGTQIALRGEPEDYFWWVSVSYLADRDGEVDLVVGDRHASMPVERGVHRYFLRGEGSVQPLTLSTPAGLGLCVDSVAVGTPSALEPL